MYLKTGGQFIVICLNKLHHTLQQSYLYTHISLCMYKQYPLDVTHPDLTALGLYIWYNTSSVLTYRCGFLYNYHAQEVEVSQVSLHVWHIGKTGEVGITWRVSVMAVRKPHVLSWEEAKSDNSVLSVETKFWCQVINDT